MSTRSLSDIRWLGWDWGDRLYFASNYFEQMYEYAVQLIKKGKAYVDELSAEQIREYRGTLTEPGKPALTGTVRLRKISIYLNACGPGNSLTAHMFLRAKIDMASPNMNMRDPVMYRILHATHPLRVINGVSTRCTTGPTVLKTPSKGLPIPSVHWNLKTTVRCMTGFWMSWDLSSSAN